MNEFTKNLIDSMKIVVNDAIKEAKYDKTIRAEVIRVEDKRLNIYKVKYQDSTFKATCIDTDSSFEVGDLVYILLPEGNINSPNKTILGSATSLGTQVKRVTDVKNSYAEIDAYNIQGGDLCSYIENQEKIILKKLKNQSLISSINDCGEFRLDMKVKTAIPYEQRTGTGLYGIKLTLKYANSTKVKFFTSTNMSGNPYKYLINTPQSIIIKLDEDELIGIEDISIFSTEFPVVNNFANNNDIFISDIKLSAIEKDQIDDKGYSLRITPSNGFYFTTDTQKELNAQLRLNGDAVQSEVKYVWLKEDASEQDRSEYAAAGWRVLYEDAKKITVNVDDNLSSDNQYKCIAYFGDDKIERDFIVKNPSAKYSAIIKSSTPDVVKPEAKPTLTCILMKEDEEAKIDGLIYNWIEVDSNGREHFLDKEEIFEKSISAVNDKPNKICIDASKVVAFSTYKCVVTSPDGAITEVARYTLRVNAVGNEKAYFLSFENEIPTIQYNADYSLDTSIKLNPLKFRLYKTEDGSLIDVDSEIKNGILTCTWSVTKNGLLSIEKPSESNENFNCLNDVSSFNYTPERVYDETKKSSLIKLDVSYAGYTYTISTNVTAFRNGLPGTNGTQYYFKVEPERYDSKFRYTIYTGARKSVFANYSQSNISTIVYKDGIRVPAEISHENENGIDTYYAKVSDGYTLSNVLLNSTVSYEGDEFALADEKSPYVGILQGYGFDTVEYNTNGTAPVYDNVNPFKVIVMDAFGEDISDEYNYIWTIDGRNLSIVSSENNTCKIVPSEKLVDSIETNGFVHCTIINDENTVTAYITIPIYFYFNRYTYSAINGWNGKSIKMDDDSISSPQLIAGFKNEEDNTLNGVVIGKLNVKGRAAQSGLMGLNHNNSTFLLSSEDGSLRLGLPGGNNTIYFSPNDDGDSNNKVINMGKGQFSVDKDGHMICKSASFVGTDESQNIFKIEDGGLVGQKLEGYTYLYKSANCTFAINADSKLEMVGTNAEIAQKEPMISFNDEITIPWNFTYKKKYITSDAGYLPGNFTGSGTISFFPEKEEYQAVSIGNNQFKIAFDEMGLDDIISELGLSEIEQEFEQVEYDGSSSDAEVDKDEEGDTNSLSSGIIYSQETYRICDITLNRTNSLSIILKVKTRLDDESNVSDNFRINPKAMYYADAFKIFTNSSNQTVLEINPGLLKIDCQDQTSYISTPKLITSILFATNGNIPNLNTTTITNNDDPVQITIGKNNLNTNRNELILLSSNKRSSIYIDNSPNNDVSFGLWSYDNNNYILQYHKDLQFQDINMESLGEDGKTQQWYTTKGATYVNNLYIAPWGTPNIYKKPVASSSIEGKKVSELYISESKNFKVLSQTGGTSTNKSQYIYRIIKFSTSDIRLKENIEDTKQSGLDLISKIKVREFNWKDDNRKQSIGFIADELEELDPNLADGGGYDKNGIMNVKSVDTFYLMGYVVKAEQELYDLVKKQQAEISELKKQLAQLSLN